MNAHFVNIKVDREERPDLGSAARRGARWHRQGQRHAGPYPEPDGARADPEAVVAFELLMAFILRVRRIRTELDLPPRQTAPGAGPPAFQAGTPLVGREPLRGDADRAHRIHRAPPRRGRARHGGGARRRHPDPGPARGRAGVLLPYGNPRISSMLTTILPPCASTLVVVRFRGRRRNPSHAGPRQGGKHHGNRHFRCPEVRQQT